MVHRPELLDALEAAPTGPIETDAWRHMFGRASPDHENTGGARWNPPGVAALYLSRTREGAIAEGDHAVAVQPFRPRARRFVYPVALTLSRVVDLTDEKALSTTGLTDSDIGDDDHTTCQEVGAAADWLERDGLLVPSARHQEANLVIYPAHRSPAALFDAGASEELGS